MRIAFAASAAVCNDHLLTSALQITNQLTRCAITDNAADRNFDDPVIAAVSVTVAAHAMLPAASFVELLITKVEQCRELRIRNGDHITAAAAIAAARTAAWDEFLAPKTDAAAPAISGVSEDFDSINKHEERLTG